MARVTPAYSAHTPTSVSSPFLKGLGSGTAGGTWASSQTTAVRFLPGATERRSDATLAKAMAVWVAFFRSVPRYVRSMKVVPRTRSIFKFSSSSAESAGSPTLRLVSSATGRLAARRTIAGVVSVSLVSGPGAGGPILRSLSTHTWAVGLYIGSRRNITRLTRATIMAAITAMSSAPPHALAAIPASTPRTLPVFPSAITAPIVAKARRQRKVDSGDLRAYRADPTAGFSEHDPHCMIHMCGPDERLV